MEVVVYLHGDGQFGESWYRVVLPLPPLKALTSAGIFPVALLDGLTFGRGGGWDFIGDTIYWTGGWDFELQQKLFCDKLIKHDTTISDRTHWVIESSTMKIPRTSPFVAALGGGTHLCVLGGQELQLYIHGREEPSLQSTDRVKCGETYDLNKTSWTLLDANYSHISDHNVQMSAVAVVEEEDGVEPSQIVFYDLREGCFQFLDVANGGTLTDPVSHPHFNLWWELPPPRASGDTIILTGDTILEDSMLGISMSRSRAVFAGSTFYWLTPALILCGYDIVAKRWFQSQSLWYQLPQVPWVGECPMCPILLFVQKGMFLVIIPQEPGVLTMAFLSVEVDKQECSYRVSVDCVPPIFFDNPSFMTRDAKAKLLKNPGSGCMS